MVLDAHKAFIRGVLIKLCSYNKKKRTQRLYTHSKLIKHKLAGGTGSIDFEDYYVAAVLAQLPDWFQTQANTLWGQIENISLLHLNLMRWLLSTPLGTIIPSTISPTMKASVQAWKKIIQHTDYSPTNQSNQYANRSPLPPITRLLIGPLGPKRNELFTRSATRDTTQNLFPPANKMFCSLGTHPKNIA